MAVTTGHYCSIAAQLGAALPSLDYDYPDTWEDVTDALGNLAILIADRADGKTYDDWYERIDRAALAFAELWKSSDDVRAGFPHALVPLADEATKGGEV